MRAEDFRPNFFGITFAHCLPMENLRETVVENFVARIKAFSIALADYTKDLLAQRTHKARRGLIFLAVALFTGVFGVGWGAFLGWESLVFAGYSPWAASAMVAGVFWLLCFLALVGFMVFSSVKAKPTVLSVESRVLEQRLEDSGNALITATQGVFDIRRVVRAYSAEIALGAMAAGFVVGTQVQLGGRGDALDSADSNHH